MVIKVVMYLITAVLPILLYMCSKIIKSESEKSAKMLKIVAMIMFIVATIIACVLLLLNLTVKMQVYIELATVGIEILVYIVVLVMSYKICQKTRN